MEPSLIEHITVINCRIRVAQSCSYGPSQSWQNRWQDSWVLISRGLHQHASRILDLEQFVAEEANRIPSCEEILTARRNPAPSDQRKMAIIEKRNRQSASCTSTKRTQFFTLLEILYEWQVHIHHAGSSNNYRSVVEGGLVAGGTSDRRGRQACFFSGMNPMEEPLPCVIEFLTNEPRMAHYKHSKKSRS